MRYLKFVSGFLILFFSFSIIGHNIEIEKGKVTKESEMKPFASSDEFDTLIYIARFHGHWGPNAVLGYRLGQKALSILKANPYFDIDVNYFGPIETPKSCIIDGLQLSTGATFGKGNITKNPSPYISVFVKNKKDGNSVILCIRKNVFSIIDSLLKSGITLKEVTEIIWNTPADSLIDLNCIIEFSE